MSKTTDNLKAAYTGESQARNKYTFFAKVARKEGYHYIAKIFEETAENEKQHAKDHLKLLNGIGDTAANLKEAMGGEDYEVESMYPGFAEIAEEEGEKAAALAFSHARDAEGFHAKLYERAIMNVIMSRMIWIAGRIERIEETDAEAQTPRTARELAWLERRRRERYAASDVVLAACAVVVGIYLGLEVHPAFFLVGSGSGLGSIVWGMIVYDRRKQELFRTSIRSRPLSGD